MTDDDSRILHDLAQDAERVIGEAAQLVARRALAAAVTAFVVCDDAVARRQTREDVLPVFRAVEARVDQEDGRLARCATARVVIGELRLSLQCPGARQTLRHRSQYAKYVRG